MFLYKGSYLEQDIEKLRKEIKKTDYEKTIEPFQERIKELEEQLYLKNKEMEQLYLASKNLINSIDRNYINVIISLDKPKAFYGRPEECLPQEVRFERVTIPVKQDLLEHFIYQLNHYEKQLKVGGSNE